MVGLSAAQGYAQVCGLPAAVIVHVDCGTQALAGAVHNASTARIPVFIYAGASPYTENGELAGSRNEFIHWLQVRDIPHSVLSTESRLELTEDWWAPERGRPTADCAAIHAPCRRDPVGDECAASDPPRAAVRQLGAAG